jgi:hypothetical protein
MRLFAPDQYKRRDTGPTLANSQAGFFTYLVFQSLRGIHCEVVCTDRFGFDVLAGLR